MSTVTPSASPTENKWQQQRDLEAKRLAYWRKSASKAKTPIDQKTLIRHLESLSGRDLRDEAAEHFKAGKAGHEVLGMAEEYALIIDCLLHTIARCEQHPALAALSAAEVLGKQPKA